MRTTPHGRRRRGLAFTSFISAGALMIAACGGDDGGSTNTTAAATTAAPQTTAAPPTTAGGTETTAPETTAPETTAPPEQPTMGGRLVISGEAEVANPWTPGKMQCDMYCQQRARTFFDPLVAIGTDLQPHPYLAESVTPNADNTEFTIKVRAKDDGSPILFHDGTPVNADAVIKNLQVGGTGLLIAKALKDVAKNADGSLKIEKIDDMTLKIYTGKDGDPTKPLPWANFPSYLSGQWGLIASPAWLDAAAADPTLEAKPVGSGPFVFVSYNPNDKLVVKRNPDYWQKDAFGNQLPYLDELEFRVINDSVTAQKALENGDIDMLSTSSGQVIASFRDKPDKFPMQEQSELGETSYILLHLTHPGTALVDRRVRCALSMAINRQEVIDAVGGGINTPANGPFSPGQDGYLEDNGLPMEQDLDAAKALIDEYKADKGVNQVKIMYGKTPDALNDTVAELYKGWWDQIGVTTDVVTVEQSAYITNALFGADNFEAYGWRNHAGFTADSQYYWWHSSAAVDPPGLSLNFGRLRDPEIDRLLDEVRTNPDPEARKAAAQDINRQFGKECWIIPVSWTIWGIPHKATVQGLGQTPLPDGSGVLARDGAGFAGQFWVNTLWVKR